MVTFAPRCTSTDAPLSFSLNVYSATPLHCSAFVVHANRPEIVGQILVRRQIIIRHGEITFLSPIAAPGVSDDESARLIVVAHCHYRVASSHLFLRTRHVQDTGLCDCRRFESIINRETEDKWESVGQASAHLGYCANSVI